MSGGAHLLLLLLLAAAAAGFTAAGLAGGGGSAALALSEHLQEKLDVNVTKKSKSGIHRIPVQILAEFHRQETFLFKQIPVHFKVRINV